MKQKPDKERFQGMWKYYEEMERLKQWPELTKSWRERRLESVEEKDNNNK